MAFSDHSQLPDPLRGLVEAELASGERVTWVEQPIAGRLARSALPVLLFAIPWTLFALFWMAGAAATTSRANGGPERLFPLFGLPFVLVGLAMLSSPYWAARSAKRTAYVLTDRRAIIFQSGWTSVTVRSFEREKLGDLRRTQAPDGSGDLVFTEDVSSGRRGTTTTDVGFLAIPDVKAAEERVRALAGGTGW